MPQEVVDNVRNIKGLCICKYQNFVKNRTVSQNQAFTAPISQNNIKLFKHAITSSVIVQLNRPTNSLNSLEYCDNITIPYISTYLRNHNRVDVVYDIYKKYSLKSATRDKRGTGIRRPVNLTTKIPNNWASFLRVDMTKKSISMFLPNT